MQTSEKSSKPTKLNMVSETLTAVEADVVMELRKLEAYGKIEIHKDQNGRPDYYIVHASVKKVLK